MKIYEFYDRNTAWVKNAWVLANSEKEARKYLTDKRKEYERLYDREENAQWVLTTSYPIDEPGYLFDIEE